MKKTQKITTISKLTFIERNYRWNSVYELIVRCIGFNLCLSRV